MLKVKNSPLKPLALAATIGLTLAGCSSERAEPMPEPMRVATLTVVADVLDNQREFNASVVPADLTRLSFRVDGKISDIAVLSGQSVKRGQLIARLIDSTARDALTDAKAQYALLDRQLRRAQTLAGQDLLSQAELDELAANHRLAKANLKAAELSLRYTELFAPFDGVVSEVNKKDFETVQPGEAVITLYRNDRIDIQVPLPDALLSQVDPGQPDNQGYQPIVRVGDTGRSYPAHYLEHTLELDPSSRTFHMWLTMAPTAEPIRPGQPVTVVVDMKAAELDLPEGFTVPMTALQAGASPDAFYAWRLEDNRATRIDVTVGELTQSGAQILDGVDAGDRLIVTGLSRLRNGMTVQAMPQNPTTQPQDQQ
ncbi:efflux RND transporter periplasmic adaptor subunit [Ferrimonas pelagia]|uniref:Multidrug efflux RND transporter periplasmic adaptor subunit VmeU n=1 Tax=Ferrimonas pelagia TaxID=1177826 RepID=A0ABP9EQ77_9GAMM